MRHAARATSVTVAGLALLTLGVVTLGNPWHTDPVEGWPTPSSSPSVCKSVDGLPDPYCTPGKVDPAATFQALCFPVGKTWSRTHRPPVSYTDPIKIRKIRAYGNYAGSSPSSYELDHLVPISWGGDARSEENLWPENPATPNPKDKLEAAGLTAICHHKIDLADAQQSIAHDWKALAVRLDVKL
jgi:hypothetical protein